MMDNKRKVLIVENSPSQIQFLKEVLRSGGYSMELASIGETAIFNAHNIPYDMILLNLILPDTSGYKVLSSIKSSPVNSKTPVLMMSSKYEMNSMQKAMTMGATDFLANPIVPDILLAKIEKIINHYKFV
jgi:PleD family two-component response regulator